MDNQVINGIIVGAATLIAAIISSFVLFKQNQKLKSEVKLLSTGMAVAYYFSFIKPLFEILEKKDIELKNDNTKIPINLNSLKLNLYIPRSLEEYEFKKTKSEIDNSQSGLIVRNDEILFRVNYKIEKATNDLLIIVDFPKILDAAVKYFEKSTRKITGKPNPDFEKINKEEIENFSSKLKEMINHSNYNDRINLI